jgi:hypothetical protein
MSGKEIDRTSVGEAARLQTPAWLLGGCMGSAGTKSGLVMEVAVVLPLFAAFPVCMCACCMMNNYNGRPDAGSAI